MRGRDFKSSSDLKSYFHPQMSAKIYHKGAFYHVYNRGVRRGDIFMDSDDYTYFLKRLRYYKNKYKIALLAYVLMPNHIHLQTKQLTEDKPMWRMMQYVCNGYTLFFNKKYNMAGRLFESQFKAIFIDTEEYLSYVSAYIHLNPIDLGYTVDNLQTYPWSSYPEYIGMRNGTLPAQFFLFREFGGRDFKSNEDLKSFHREYRTFVEAGIPYRVEKNLGKYLIEEDGKGFKSLTDLKPS